MAIDSKLCIELNGKSYPLYQAILAEAHERGLQSITVDLVQVPGPDNDHTAICRATVRMKDGGEFQDWGDSSPRNVNSRIATALIRMASTRAKGRALRDAINVGQTMAEELPDLVEEADSAIRGKLGGAAPPPRPARPAEAGQKGGQAPAGREKLVCAGCGKEITLGQKEVSERAFGTALCPACQKTYNATSPAPPPQEKLLTMPDGRALSLKAILAGWERAERDAQAAGIEPPELDLLVCEPEDVYRAAMELAQRVAEARKAAAAA